MHMNATENESRQHAKGIRSIINGPAAFAVTVVAVVIFTLALTQPSLSAGAFADEGTTLTAAAPSEEAAAQALPSASTV